MDAGDYATAIARRYAFLVGYYDQPVRRHLDKAEMRLEFRVLEADARRWGLTPWLISSRVLAELLVLHDRETAHRLHGVFTEAFPDPPAVLLER